MKCLSSALACLDALADHKNDPEFTFWFAEMRTACAPHVAKGTPVSVNQWKDMFAQMLEKHKPPCARCGRSGHLAKVCHCYNHATQTIEGTSMKRLLIEEKYLSIGKKGKTGKPDYLVGPGYGTDRPVYGHDGYMGEAGYGRDAMHFQGPPTMWTQPPPLSGMPGMMPPPRPSFTRGAQR